MHLYRNSSLSSCFDTSVSDPGPKYRKTDQGTIRGASPVSAKWRSGAYCCFEGRGEEEDSHDGKKAWEDQQGYCHPCRHCQGHRKGNANRACCLPSGEGHMDICVPIDCGLHIIRYFVLENKSLGQGLHCLTNWWQTPSNNVRVTSTRSI